MVSLYQYDVLFLPMTAFAVVSISGTDICRAMRPDCTSCTSDSLYLSLVLSRNALCLTFQMKTSVMHSMLSFPMISTGAHG